MWLCFFVQRPLITDDGQLASVMNFVGYQYQKEKAREGMIALQEVENDDDQT
jgi:hypothetical protein